MSCEGYSLAISHVPHPLQLRLCLTVPRVMASEKVKLGPAELATGPLAEHVQAPGYWRGAYAGYKWKGGGARCDFYNLQEIPYIPARFMAMVPRTAVEELED
ncbi:hypothetical protein BJX70DRAFT_397255 [Aspergillus crustosus]